MEKNNYIVRITPRAYDDLDDIYSYIVSELYNDIAAEELMEKIENNIMRLSEFPLSGSFVEDENLKNRFSSKTVGEFLLIPRKCLFYF